MKKTLHLFFYLFITFLSANNLYAQLDSIYFTNYAATPATPGTGTTSWTTASFNFATSTLSGWSNYNATTFPAYGSTSSSSGFCQLNFSIPLNLVTNGTDRGKIIVNWGANANRPLNISINGGTNALVDEVTLAAQRNVVREAVLDIPNAVTNLSSIRFVSSGGSGVFLFNVKVLTYPSCTNPSVFNVSGSGTICSGTGTVTLSGSQTGVKYQLFKDNVAEGSPIDGTGSALSFTAATTGVYTVKTTTFNNYCETTMNGSANIVIGGAVPNINSQNTPAATYNVGDVATPLTVSSTGLVSYQWFSNATANNTGGTNLGSANGAQTNSFTPPTTTPGTTYYYCVVSGCGPDVVSAVSGAITVNFVPATTQMRFGADHTTNVATYTFATTDKAHAVSGNLSNSGSNLCAGALRRTQVNSIILELVSTSASAITIHGQSSGASTRTILEVSVADTKEGTYTVLDNVTNASTNITSNIANSSSCGTTTVTGLNIPVGKFVKFTFCTSASSTALANVNVSGFDVVQANPLPVKFVSVQAKNNGYETQINWVVANEVNIAYYIVEQSLNGISFSAVKEIGVSNVTSYTTTLNRLENAAVYYRIKAVDQDGKFSYSSIIRLNNEQHNLPELLVYPNPVKNGLVQLQLSNIEAGKYRINIVNAAGLVLKSQPIIYNAGNTAYSLQMPTVNKGIYYVTLTNSNNKNVVIKTVLIE